MGLTKNELLHYWNYFRTLCKRLDNTRQYISHSVEGDELKFKDVTSWEFQQILFLAAMEFENISKQICYHFDNSFNIRNSDIKKITKFILNKYPNIGKTEIITDYQVMKPLELWKIYQDSPNDKEKVIGIPWWNDYDNLKHQSFKMFHLATLNNAVSSLASLMVIELYLMREITGSVIISLEKPCDYFSSPYPSDLLCTEEMALPDFSGAPNKNLVQDESLNICTIGSYNI